MSCILQFMNGHQRPLKRLMTYSASAYRLFRLGMLEPGKEWVKKKTTSWKWRETLEIGELSEDECQGTLSILSQQHTREVTARGDRTGACVAFCLTTLGQQWPPCCRLRLTDREPTSWATQGVSAWLNPQILDELSFNMPHLGNLDKLLHIF